MKIEVTQSLIDNGIKQSCSYCPIARAVSQKFPNNPVRVYTDYIRIGSIPYTLPKAAQDFIMQYDFGYPVSPFSFELETGGE